MNTILIKPHYCSKGEHSELKNYLENESWDFKEINNNFDNAQQLKSSIGDLIDELENLINKMPQKGLKSNSCQRTALKNSLNTFSQCVNGIEESDLAED